MTSPVRRVLRKIFARSVLAVLGLQPLSFSISAAELAGEPVVGVPKDVSARIKFLRAEIARNDELYHRHAQPEISDYDYDQLKRELTTLEEQFPDIATQLGASPVRNVGDDRTPGFARYRHRERMLSLDKTYSEADVRAFHARLIKQLRRDQLAYVVEPKFDGLAASATYEHGRLVRVAPRGDGVEGDDVTANALTIRALPRTLKTPAGTEPPALIEVRGEIYISFAEFQRLNRERQESGEAEFASPRNLAAGTLKSLDPRETARRKLDVVFYGIGAVEPASAAPASQQALLAQFRAWGLPTVEFFRTADSIDAVWAAVQEIGRARPGLPYPTDGAVVKLDDVAGQRELGTTEQAPRWAIAYKFAPERVTTRLNAITLQVGRTGVITPVAELQPVRLDGALISRATLHNADEIARRDIRIGDYVYIERTGEVIPAIVGVDQGRRAATSTPFVFPPVCPTCGQPIMRRTAEVAWRCTNLACPAQVKRRIRHFASDECVGIKGLGEATIDSLVDRGLVHDISDLYRLRREDLVVSSGGGAVRTDALLAAIAESKHAELWRFINGLGIPGIGATGSKALARRYGSLEKLAAARDDELKDVDGFGSETAKAGMAFLASPAESKLIADLVLLGIAPHGADADGKLSGKLVVLTGTLQNLTRRRAIELIEAAGGKTADSVSRRTSYLVAGADPGAKLAHARELGVPIIDEAELLRLIGDASAKE